MGAYLLTVFWAHLVNAERSQANAQNKKNYMDDYHDFIERKKVNISNILWVCGVHPSQL